MARDFAIKWASYWATKTILASWGTPPFGRGRGRSGATLIAMPLKGRLIFGHFRVPFSAPFVGKIRDGILTSSKWLENGTIFGHKMGCVLGYEGHFGVV